MRGGGWTGRSGSKNIGSIMLMSSKFPDIGLENIQDPNGLARVIRSAIDMLFEDNKK